MPTPHDPGAVADAIAATPTRAFLAGTWTDTAAELVVDDPATGSPLAAVSDTDAGHFAAALDAAVAAQPTIGSLAPRDRAEVLRRTYELMKRDRDRLALLITLEMGKPLTEAGGEVDYAAEFFRWFSEEAARLDGGYRTNPAGTGRIVETRRPVGPSLLITPWNFPLAMGARKIAPAFASGSTAILKPAELTPLSSLAIAELMREAGLPDGALSVLPTSEPGPATEALLADHRLRKLSFTGSTAVGKHLLSLAADNVLRTSMELGGNAPFLVFDDADLDAALDGAFAAKLRNGGEACTSANRFLVHQSVVDQFTERFAARLAGLRLGHGTVPDVDLGPLIDHSAQKRIGERVGEAREAGASVVTGGSAVDGEGWFFEPTVLTGVADDSALVTDEIFGPVAPIRSFSDEDEAIAVANDTPYGLVSYAYTRDLARSLRLGERLEAGMIGLNRGVVSDPAAPFGGVKHSGLGREGGGLGIDEYLEPTYLALP